MAQHGNRSPCTRASLTIAAIPELYQDCCVAMERHLTSEGASPALARWWQSHQEERTALANMMEPTPWISQSGFVTGMCGALVCHTDPEIRDGARTLNHAIALARYEREMRRFSS